MRLSCLWRVFACRRQHCAGLNGSVLGSEGGASGGPALASKLVHEWDGTETAVLPEWVVQSIERGYGANERGEPTIDAPKIGFHLLRHPASDMPQMQQGKLNAPQILRARKVLSYAVSKLGLQDPPPNMLRDGLPNTVDYLELLCQDQIVPPGARRPAPPSPQSVVHVPRAPCVSSHVCACSQVRVHMVMGRASVRVSGLCALPRLAFL